MRSDDATTREVQRYAPEGHPCECGMQECDWGEYVKFEDAEARIATLAAEVERVKGELEASLPPHTHGDQVDCDARGYLLGLLSGQKDEWSQRTIRRLLTWENRGADVLKEVREEVGGLLRVENFVEGYGIVDTVILEELTEALDALDATRGET